MLSDTIFRHRAQGYVFRTDHAHDSCIDAIKDARHAEENRGLEGAHVVQ